MAGKQRTNIYRDQLSSNEGQRAFEAAKAKLENNVDDAVSDFVECFTLASQCMIKKCHMKKHILKVLHGTMMNTRKQKSKVTKN